MWHKAWDALTRRRAGSSRETSMTENLWLVVGLGNPGPSYAGNRHNIGYLVNDELASRVGSGFRPHKTGRADVVEGRLGGPGGARVVLAVGALANADDLIALLEAAIQVGRAAGGFDRGDRVHGLDPQALIVLGEVLPQLDRSLVLDGWGRGHDAVLSPVPTLRRV